MINQKRSIVAQMLAILAGMLAAGLSPANASVILEASGASGTGPSSGASAEVQYQVYQNTGNWETSLGISGNVTGLGGTTTGTEQFVYFYEISQINAGSTINLLLVNTPSADSVGYLSGTVFSAPNAVSPPTGLTSGTGIAPDAGSVSPSNAAFNWNSGLTPASPNSLILFITSNNPNVLTVDNTLRFFPFTQDSGTTQAPGSAAPTPLPPTFGLLLSAIPGLAGVVAVARRKKLFVGQSA